MRCLVAVLVLIVSLSGCWPARFTTEPGVTGTVVSSIDRTPIADAHVTLSWGRVDHVQGEHAIDTDARGRFRIRPVSRWGLYSYLGESWPQQGWVAIEAPGFAPQRREWNWPITGAKTQNLGVVVLAPVR